MFIYLRRRIKPEKIKEPKTSEIKELKITVRMLTKEDVKTRRLPENTTGVVIVKIEDNSPVNYLNINAFYF